jgi:competence ComEA-like helix-hairpin-helix protein
MKKLLSIAVALAALTTSAVVAQESRSLQAARAVTIALVLLNYDQEAQDEQAMCNLNEDSAEEISAAIPEISSRLAERIVSYRNRNGPYRSILDVLAVPGLDSEIVLRNGERIAL